MSERLKDDPVKLSKVLAELRGLDPKLVNNPNTLNEEPLLREMVAAVLGEMATKDVGAPHTDLIVGIGRVGSILARDIREQVRFAPNDETATVCLLEDEDLEPGMLINPYGKYVAGRLQRGVVVTGSVEDIGERETKIANQVRQNGVLVERVVSVVNNTNVRMRDGLTYSSLFLSHSSRTLIDDMQSERRCKHPTCGPICVNA